MLTQESLEKIFEVLSKIKVFHGNGYPLEKARHKATEEVARTYGITYQTIEDGYRRRLGLRNINEFQIMLDEWTKGDAKSLIGLLTTHTDKTSHMRIYEFFESDKTIKPITKTAKDKLILIYLSSEVYDKMKLLSKKQNKTGSEWLSEKCEAIINDEHFNYWESEIGKLSDEQKKRLFSKIMNPDS
jgi:predicted DNA-binding protein